MKISKLLLLVVAALAFACSGDDDEPSLEKRTLSFSADEQLVAAPAAMENVENYAAEAVRNMIDEANGMTTYLSMMQVPNGASKGGDRITAANGRVNAAGDYAVYTWSDGNGGEVAYQISETSDSYAFEIFIRDVDDHPEWALLFRAEEKKDRSAGFLNVYDIDFSDDPATILFAYTWSRSGGQFTFTFSVPDEDPEYDQSVTLVINEKTKAGSVVSKTGGVKDFEITWDAAGNGTYVYYDDEGVVSDQGTWTV